MKRIDLMPAIEAHIAISPIYVIGLSNKHTHTFQGESSVFHKNNLKFDIFNLQNAKNVD